VSGVRRSQACSLKICSRESGLAKAARRSGSRRLGWFGVDMSEDELPKYDHQRTWLNESRAGPANCVVFTHYGPERPGQSNQIKPNQTAGVVSGQWTVDSGWWPKAVGRLSGQSQSKPVKASQTKSNHVGIQLIPPAAISGAFGWSRRRIPREFVRFVLNSVIGGVN
jgi:hypothetical protein